MGQIESNCTELLCVHCNGKLRFSCWNDCICTVYLQYTVSGDKRCTRKVHLQRDTYTYLLNDKSFTSWNTCTVFVKDTPLFEAIVDILF